VLLLGARPTFGDPGGVVEEEGEEGDEARIFCATKMAVSIAPCI
jgi:hypothetical protein